MSANRTCTCRIVGLAFLACLALLAFLLEDFRDVSQGLRRLEEDPALIDSLARASNSTNSTEVLVTLSTRLYRPVFFMHGIFGHASLGNTIKYTVESNHPGTLFTTIDLFEGWESFDHDMWTQVRGVRSFVEQKMRADPEAYEDGFNLICHSQGALLCRALISDWDNHKVKTLVTLAGPNQGIDHLHSGNLILEGLKRHSRIYSPRVQAKWSVAGWVKDMQNYEAYKTGSRFLAEINNESPKKQPRFRQNFAKLEHAIFLGSPADGTVIPWQSTVWGYYALGHSYLNPEIVPYSATPLGQQNLLPLQEMFDSGKAVILQKDGVTHAGWHHRADTVYWYLDFLK